MVLSLLLTCLGGVGLLYLYHLNRGLKAVPQEAHRLSPRRWTVREIRAAFDNVVNSPVDVSKSLPPKQNRRYVVIGGSGMYLGLRPSKQPICKVHSGVELHN